MKKVIRKKILAIVLTLAMVVSLFPVITLPVGAADDWDGTANTTWYTSNTAALFYTINSAEELAGLASLVNEGNDMNGKTFTLESDIVLNDTTNFLNWATTPPANEWTPIGNVQIASELLVTRKFLGVFDGGGHTINGLYVKGDTISEITSVNDSQALFGNIDEPGAIKNIILNNCYVYGYSYSAGICGYNYGGTISGCSVSGVITGFGNNYGGITGCNGLNGIIYRCVNNANVTSEKVAAGIAGVSNGRIYDCYNTGNIAATVTPFSDAGGIVGQNSNTAIIFNCYNLGSITGVDTAGGIASYNTGTITNCYSSAAVNALDVFGLTFSENTGSINFSYWNSELFTGTGYSGTAVECLSKTTSEMQSPDFVTLLNNNKGIYSFWTTDAGGYPSFAPSNTAPTVDTPDTISYTDTAANDAFSDTIGTLSATDSDGEITSYGITGGITGGSTNIGSTVYDVSMTKTYGKLYVNSSTGQYLYDPDDAAVNSVPPGNTSEIFTVTATDNGGLSGSATLTVSITGANDTPTDIALSSNLINENVIANSTVGTLSSTDPDTGNTFIYTLVEGDGSADNALFNIASNNLRISGSPDYETINSYSVRVRTTDQSGLWYEEAFTININDINETPTDIALSTSSINENVAGNPTVGTLSSTDPDAYNTFTYSLVAGTGSTDNASFNISGSSLRITNSPDYETKNSYSVRIRTTDQGTLFFEKAFTITVNDINEAPTDIALSPNFIDENVAADSTVGTISSTDPDAGDTFTYTLVAGDGSTDNAAFNINGSSLRISSTPDYEAKNSYSVRIRTADQGGLTYEEAFTITINNLNESPADITLSESSINENIAGNSVVGVLTTMDPDAGDTFTYSLVAGTGSTDNGSFSIDGSNLRILSILDYETKNSYSVRIRTTDQGTLSIEKVFTITVNDINEAPTDMTLSSSALNENVAANTVVGTLSSTDPDAGNTFTYSIVSVDGDTASTAFNIDGINLRITNSPDYETKNSYLVRVRTTDQGGLWYEEAFTITINDANDAPVITSAATVSFVENGTGVAYSAAATDIESDTITWSISGIDVSLFSMDSATGEITFIAPPDFETPGDNGHDNEYNLTLIATDDGTGNLSSTKDLAITVTDFNEAPVISTSSTVSVTEGRTAAFTAAATDPEGNDITWSITGGKDAAKFSIVAATGVTTFITAPSFSAPTDADADNQYILEIAASDGAQIVVKTITVTVTRQVSNSSPSTPSTPTSNDAVVEVNGESQSAGQVITQMTGGTTITTIAVDDDKLNNILEQTGNNATVSLPVYTASDVVVGQLNGQTVKNMEAKEARLEIKTETVTYTLPASQINIDDVSEQIGEQVALKDITVNVKIAEPSAETVKIVEDTAQKGNYQLVVKPVEFEITCTSGDITVEVFKFNGYVERTVAIPDSVDPSKITTGIVLNSDGTFHHVPTEIIVINGKYYAKISSLTNSVYSVIWNPVTFSDLAGYGVTGDTINDLGSRLIISGVGNNKYEPERDITRAEFSIIIVKALGLRPTSGKSSFSDVAIAARYTPYIQTAYEYGIISGYGNGKFGPDDRITREQAITIIGNAMKITGLNTSFGTDDVNKILSAYTDSGEIVSWGRQSMAACIRAGIISGRGNMTLAPKAYITRAEVAIIVRKLLVKSGLI